MKTMQVAFVLVALLLALLFGIYFSGMLVKWLIGVDVPVDFKTWWMYFQSMDASRMQPYVDGNS